jgi:hypothetical protein
MPIGQHEVKHSLGKGLFRFDCLNPTLEFEVDRPGGINGNIPYFVDNALDKNSSEVSHRLSN